jgi:hypothetical protein
MCELGIGMNKYNTNAVWWNVDNFTRPSMVVMDVTLIYCRLEGDVL